MNVINVGYAKQDVVNGIKKAISRRSSQN